MATIKIPERFPSDLQARDSTARQPVQVAQAVRADALAVCEDAIAHLVAARPLCPPPTLNHVALTTTAKTLRTKIAVPPARLYAAVHGQLTCSAASDTVTARVQTATEPTWVSSTFDIGRAGIDDPISFELLVEIGTGALTAPATELVTLELTTTGALDTTLISWGVVILPIYAPWADPEIST